MELQFLGTSSGTPTKSRNVTAITLKESQGNKWYLIDCGEGTQHQLLHTHLSLNSLSAIFITHVHGDHCYGLPGLLASAGMNGRSAPLTIVAPKGIKEFVEAIQTHTELYLPFEITFISSEDFPQLTFDHITVSLTELSHRVPSFAYSFVESKHQLNLDIQKLQSTAIPKGPLWGKLQSGTDVELDGTLYRSQDFVTKIEHFKKIIICGDNDSPELLSQEAQDCHLLVHEATYASEMADRAKSVGHSYARQVAAFAEQASIANLVLTHFSPRYQGSIQDLYHEAQSVYSGSLFLAKDFERYCLNQSLQLQLLEND